MRHTCQKVRKSLRASLLPHIWMPLDQRCTTVLWQCMWSVVMHVVGCNACGRHAAVHSVPASISMKAARVEAEMVMFESVREVLAACNLKPRQASTYLYHWIFANYTLCPTGRSCCE